MVYFRFNDNNDNEEESKQSLLMCILDWIHPNANPDFEKKFPFVMCWYIEYDEINNYTNREIGIDKKGGMITKDPFFRNLGIWCDSDVTLDVYKSFGIKIIEEESINYGILPS